MKTKVHHKKRRKTATLDVIEKFIRLQSQKFLRQYDADSMAAALKEVSGELEDVACLQFFVSRKKEKSEIKYIPKQFNYKNYKILTDVVVEGEVSHDSASFQPGDGAYREGGHEKGTIGLKVYRDEKTAELDANGNPVVSRRYFALSCFHVFCRPELDNRIFPYVPVTNAKVFANSNSETIELGEVSVGIFSTSIDASLAELKDESLLNKLAKGFVESPKYGVRSIVQKDVEQKLTVFLYGDKSKKRTGIVLAKSVNKPITYSSGTYNFNDLIRVSKMSDPGDSGACVFDGAGRVVGLLSASSDQASYIIPINKIIFNLNFKIDYA